jgi:predicted secreted Zn-dependent protease
MQKITNRGAFAMAVTARRGRTSTGTYNVCGSTLYEINRNIQRLGPVDPNDGRRYSGVCRCTIDIQLGRRDVQFETTPGSSPLEVTATVTGGYVTNTCAITMPRLRSESALSSAARQEWRRFLAAVEAHEQGHVDSYFPEAETIARALDGLSAPGTGRNENAARRAAAEALNTLIESRYSQSQLVAIANANAAAYDRRNRHGATQGAVLNVTIT